ncbi:prolyl aminopeptidase [Tropicimonas sp. IMCC34043]|uniref:prolyl aminopeptidase n=1 Tax=Tropicimonas sp. IMCC34043 TaxID=2248760 RepID=UPI000E221332|nr:prolyl aminopeptidase [Tropicimonas sp. IMCC34043]
MTERRGLFPPCDPYREGWLRVSDRHRIYYQEAGNPDGKPALILHGGPGGSIADYMRRLHDPAAYRIVLFDQRGCGRSEPHAGIADNTTWHLVADIEALRRLLGIERWQVMGGSWGSTLGLAYAESHPEAVSELILRGIFLMSEEELRWFYQSGASLILPEVFAAFAAPIPPAERGDMLAAYHRRLFGPDPEERLTCARAWSRWEGAALSLLPDPAREDDFETPEVAVALARLECHYFVNRGFFPEADWLLKQAPRLSGIPVRLVQGRYDLVTPMIGAHRLARALPHAVLRVVPDAGHSGTEPGIIDAVVRATEDLSPRGASRAKASAPPPDPQAPRIPDAAPSRTQRTKT